MKALLLIASVTFKELIREKTLHGLLVVFLLISIFSLILGQLSFAEQVRMSLDFGLSVMHLSVVGLSLILGAQLVQREIDRKTIFTLLVKPLQRTQYIFGKFLGLSALIFFTTFLCTLFLVLSMRYLGQFYWREIFTTGFGQWIECSILIAVVLFLSQFLKPPVTIFCGVALFLIGHWFETLRFLTQKNPDAGLKILHDVLTFVFPNLEIWNWKGMVIYGEFLSPLHLAAAFGQGLLWMGAYLFLAALLMERRDLIA
jgi:ABC-type transport system involved in multi-copper enzyme maturation permease subunit